MKSTLLAVSLISFVMGNVSLAATTTTVTTTTTTTTKSEKAAVKKAKGKKTAAIKKTTSAKKSAAKKSDLRGLLAANTAAASAQIRPMNKQTVTTVQPKQATKAANQIAENEFTGVPGERAVAEPALSGTTAKKVTKAEEKKFEPTWAFTWISNNTFDNATFQGYKKQDQEVQAWEIPTISYKFTKDLSVGVTPQFFHTWFGNAARPQDQDIVGFTQPYAMYMGNIGLGVSDSTLFKIRDAKVSGSFTYYMPTSELSQKDGSLGELWFTPVIEQPIGKWTFKYTDIAIYYMEQYSTSSLLLPNPITKILEPMQTRAFRNWALGDIIYSFTKKLSLDLTLGLEDTAYWDDPNTGRPMKFVHTRVTALDLGYAFNDHFSLDVGFWEQLDMGKQTQPFNIPFTANSDAGVNQVFFATTVKI